MFPSKRRGAKTDEEKSPVGPKFTAFPEEEDQKKEDAEKT